MGDDDGRNLPLSSVTSFQNCMLIQSTIMKGSFSSYATILAYEQGFIRYDIFSVFAEPCCKKS